VSAANETRSTPGPRRTQAERTAETRSRLLDATIECLIEQGYVGTTTLAICKRSGVSHGSLQHHFGKRDALLGAALEHVYGRLRDRVVKRLEALPVGEPRVEAMVDVMWDGFGAREFKAVLELWIAAANQPDLSWAVWPEARAFDAGNVPLAEQLFPGFAARVPDFEVYVSLLFQALQGMALVHVTLPVESENVEMRRKVRALLTRIMTGAFASSATEEHGAEA
jgi:AcrR family transcriptional regulator